ncbi:MAG: hypothetical protein IPK72_20960 [Candidatus Eisenbacteria bacterium]|nr:hypothetical protein [Candidatus Eisenbacteria bacterium]
MITANLEPLPSSHAIPEGLPAELVQSWSTAIASLTDRELSAVVLRFGFRTGKPESFAAIGRELGENRVRARAIFTNALGRLGQRRRARWRQRLPRRRLRDRNAAHFSRRVGVTDLRRDGAARRVHPPSLRSDGAELSYSVRTGRKDRCGTRSACRPRGTTGRPSASGQRGAILESHFGSFDQDGTGAPGDAHHVLGSSICCVPTVSSARLSCSSARRGSARAGDRHIRLRGPRHNRSCPRPSPNAQATITLDGQEPS